MMPGGNSDQERNGMMTRTGMFQRLRQRIGGEKTTEIPVSCYGKLPVYKDFLRKGLAGKEAQTFKQWLDRGISHYWSGDGPYRGEMIYPHAMLLRFPGTARYILAYLWGSHDAGGLRFFPFTVFLSLPAGSEGMAPHGVLEILDTLISAGRKWHDECSGFSSHQDFVRWSRNLSLQITMRPEKSVADEILKNAENLRVGDFVDALWGDDANTEWPAFLSYLDRWEEGIRTRTHGRELAIRLPTAERLSPVLQAQYWTLIIERYDRQRDRPFHLFTPLYEAGAGLTVFLRNLRPSDVFALHPTMPDYDGVENLQRSVPRHGEEDEMDLLTEAERRQPLRAFLDADFAGVMSMRD